MLPQFYSGATGQPGRFSEGFLLRRLQPSMFAICQFDPIEPIGARIYTASNWLGHSAMPLPPSR
jgi:hypothetical protein